MFNLKYLSLIIIVEIYLTNVFNYLLKSIYIIWTL